MAQRAAVVDDPAVGDQDARQHGPAVDGPAATRQADMLDEAGDTIDQVRGIRGHRATIPLVTPDLQPVRAARTAAARDRLVADGPVIVGELFVAADVPPGADPD